MSEGVNEDMYVRCRTLGTRGAPEWSRFVQQD